MTLYKLISHSNVTVPDTGIYRYNNPAGSDIRFTVKSETIYAHKCLISTRCPDFYESYDCAKNAVVPVTVIGPNLFKAFLKKVYGEPLKGISSTVENALKELERIYPIFNS